jgi:DNA-binding transcriptional ArsR family regulator
MSLRSIEEWRELDLGNCSVAATLSLVGERWTLLILREVFAGLHRFDEIAEHLGISRRVLTERLRQLVDAGLMERRSYQEAARPFAEDGFVVLVHDHRTFGASDGEPGQDVDPWQQIADWRRAISYLESRPEVDADRIGLWGSSYAGGHAIVLGATDRRLRAVVSQVPAISGYEQGLRRVAPDAVAGLEESFAQDERARFRGETPHTVAMVSSDPATPASSGHRRPSTSTCSPRPKAPGRTRSRSVPLAPRACTSPGSGSRGSHPPRCSWWSPWATR